MVLSKLLTANGSQQRKPLTADGSQWRKPLTAQHSQCRKHLTAEGFDSSKLEQLKSLSLCF